jgi:hypothetical protein
MEQTDRWQILLSGGEDEARGCNEVSLAGEDAESDTLPIVSVVHISR